MRKNAFAWIALALAAAMLYVFDNSAATLAVLALTMVIPALAVLWVLLPRKSLGVSLSAPEACQRNDSLSCCIKLTKAPVLCIVRAAVSVRNIHTGDEAAIDIELTTDQAELEILPEYCGLMEFEVRKLIVCDIFGIVRRRQECSASARIMVMPRLSKMDISVTQSSLAMPDSDEYSPNKPGYDPSETFGIREYASGDSIKSIHWKLSQKTDRTMVREYGLPVINQILLMLELPQSAAGSMINTLTEVFCSVSMALAAEQTPHRLMWMEYKSGKRISVDVRNERDFYEALEMLLEQTPNEGSSPISELREERGGFAHIVFTGRDHPDTLPDSFNGSRINALLIDSECSGMTADGSFVLGFNENDWEDRLCAFEI